MLLLLSASTSAAAALLLLLAALLALLGSRLLLLRRSTSAAIRAGTLARTHPGRRSVVGVEQRRVLGEAEAGSRFGTPPAFVPVPRRFRGRVLERQAGSLPVRRVVDVLQRQAGRAPTVVG